MADTSERIIILSAVVLVAIIVWTSTIPQIVSLDDVRIELETEKKEYVLDEDIEVKVYFHNEKPFAVRINTNIDKALVGYTPKRQPSPAILGHAYPVVYSEILPNSRIEFYTGMLTPKYSGEFFISCLGANKTVLIIDPDEEVSMPSFDIGDLLDPELALSHGFKGYINISYASKTPDRVNITSEKMINYTIQLKLIPHVPEFTETEVVLEPENERARFGILQSTPSVNINEYIRYSPNGTILLRVGEPRIVTMILSVPEGLRGISEYPQGFLGVGIFADVPIVSAYGAGIHRIMRDEGGDSIQAEMNQHSFKNSEYASLRITNNSPDTITLEDKYELHMKEGDSWVEVLESLYHPEIWHMVADIVDSGASLSQQISITMLEAGQYRISKDVHSDVPREYLLTIIVEFEIL